MARTRVPVAGTIGKSIKTVSSATDLTALTAAVAILQQQVANLVAVATANPSGLSPTDWSLITGIPPDVKNRPPGSEGEPGPEGERGPPGVPGTSGVKGDRGSPGDDGIPGDDGPPGIPGPAGPAGVGSQGPMGNPGMDGNDGLDGNDGPPGIQGTQGTTGASGPQGAPGMDGNDGLDGNDGPPGMQGVQGTTGGLGPQGVATYLEAEPGLDGNDGPPGPQGAQGVTGGQGPQGIPGFEGDIGEPGDVGPPGPIGPVGPQGATGATGNAIYQITFGEDGGAGEPDFPLLDLGISPVWSGQHTFRGPVSRPVGTAPAQISIGLAGTQPFINWLSSAAAADAHTWENFADTTGAWTLRAVNDAGTIVGNAIKLTRTGVALTGIQLGNNVDNASVTMALNANATVRAISITNSNAGASAFTGFEMVNDAGNTIQFFLRSSGGTPANGAVLQGNAGPLLVQSTVSTVQIGVAGVEAVTFNGAATTGVQICTFGTGNKPGAANATPGKWLPVTFAGVQYYIPMWP